MQYLISLFIVILLSQHCLAEIINVPDDFETIQAAINESEDGDTVLVQPGEYVENINIEGIAITVASIFLTIGDEDVIEATVVNGDASSSCIRITGVDEGVCQIVGFRVTNGDNRIGGGLNIEGSNVHLDALNINKNSATLGGGIYGRNSEMFIENCVVSTNEALDGGGLYAVRSQFEIRHCIFRENSANTWGGAIVVEDSELLLDFSEISSNESVRGWGGAIYSVGNSQTRMNKCTVCLNISGDDHGNICINREGTIEINNSILYSNNPLEVQNLGSFSVAYSDLDGGGERIENDGEFIWGDGNINDDPLFGGNFHLTENSPCINSGDPDFPEDPDGTRADMGAYYFDHNPHLLLVPREFETIQTAINASDDGDTVLVHPGEYVENINFEGKAITVASLLIITNDEAYIDSTVIDGNEEGSVVVFNSDEDENSVLKGLSITNGQGNGGGIYCAGASPSLENLHIFNNIGRRGAIYLERRSHPVGMNLLIESNTGAISGLYLDESTIRISKSCFINNTSQDEGGMTIWSVSSDISLTNCTFSGNSADYILVGNGGPDDTEVIRNCVFWENDVRQQVINGRNVDIAYTDVEGGRNAVRGNTVEWGEGNIDEDPLFLSPEEGDFHLTEDSPCIDAGDPESPEDPDGTRADMGAYYFHQIPDENPHRFDVPFEFDTFQEAINESQDADTVLVYPGEYAENIRFEGKEITVASLLLITGDVAYIDSTIINGRGRGRVILIDSQSILTGFTITNGFADLGAAIHCIECSPTISNLIVSGNGHEGFDIGGIYLLNSDAIIENVVFTNNLGRYSALGISGQGEEHSPEIRNCVFSHNQNGSPFLCLIEDCSTNFVNVTFAENVCEGFLIFGDNGVINISNSIFWRNETDRQILIMSHMVNAAWSDIEGGQNSIRAEEFVWGEGNINEDPLFVNPEEGIYHLTEDSPCIDAGDPESPEDPDGTRADMGAFYFHHEGEFVNPTNHPFDHTLFIEAYPNPFNSTTTIEYVLPFASEVTLNLYNLSGQRVETLVDGRLQAGVHRTILNAGDMASGLYFVKLEGVGKAFTQKIMLVK